MTSGSPERNAVSESGHVDGLLAVLDLSSSDARTTEDIFTGVSQAMPLGRVFGGQVLAQAVIAAERTVDDGRAAHSMHGYFLRPGDSTRGMTFSVDRIHDGRSFSTRRTQAFQEGVPIFSMIASFEVDATGLEHQDEMPSGIPGPDDLSDDSVLAGLHPMSKRHFDQSPVEVRHVEDPIYASVGSDRVAHQSVWVRTRGEVPDDPRVHRAALAYMSDLTIQESVLRAHGASWATPGLKVASLDHAMWWHRPARVDEWLLYVQQSPSAQGGRGLATGRIFSREGELVASVAQEIMVRIPDAD
ncbi:acyl-CoA thioesterase II [Microbacterium sp. LMI1x-1-1.1]